ncbi:MAG: hypothetical protein IZT59_13695 [Verrucomicrobia bacterium]|nr:hypothetical protein [Verrucomicrobiota bacterium]
MNIWKNAFQASTEGTAKQPLHKRSYEPLLNDRHNLPQYYKDQEPRFHLIPGEWQGVLLMKTCAYKTPGEVVPIPE